MSQPTQNNYGTFQHYLPRFILRAFGVGSKRSRRVWRLDKTTLMVERGRVEHFAGEHGFYDSVIHGSGNEGADGSFSEIENQVAPLLRQIVDEDSLAALDTKKRETVLHYIGRHLSRTPLQRDELSKLVEFFGFGEALKNQGASKQDVFAGHAKAGSHASIDALRSKRWVLLRGMSSRCFVVSDCWLAVDNINKQLTAKGDAVCVGLAVPGTSLRIPLSPTHSLYLVCPQSILLNSAIQPPRGFVVQDSSNLVYDNWVDAFRISQVCSAYRYVFSREDDFDREIEFLQKNSFYQMPPHNLVFEM